MKESEKNFTKKTIEGSIWEAIASIIQRVGGLIFTVILARLLLPEGFGLYNLAIAVVTVFFIFGRSGADQTLIRYVAEVSKRKRKERSFFHYILRIKIILLVAISAIILLFAYPLSEYFFRKPELFVLLILAASYLFIFSIEQFFTSFFFAVKKIKYRTLKEVVYQSARIFLAIIIFLVAYSSPQPIHAFLILILASFVSLFFIVSKTHQIAPHIFRRGEKLPKKEKKRVTKFFSYISLASISIIFLASVDVIMLGWLLPNSAPIGLYKAAFVIAASLAGVFTFSYVLLPIFIQIKKNDLKKAFNRTFKFLMLLLIPASFGLAILGNYFLVLIYGYEYLPARYPLYFLAFLITISVKVELFTQLFSAKERPEDYLPLLAFIIFLNIGLNYVLISSLLKYSEVLAITGAAMATIVSWLIYSIGLTILTRRNLKIKVTGASTIKPVIASLIMVLVIYLLKISFKDINIINGSLLVLTGVVVYSFVLLIIKGIDKDDIMVLKELKSIIKKHIKKKA